MSDNNDTPQFWSEHVHVLKERGVSVEYAWACGLRSWSGRDALRRREQYGLKGEYQGLPLYRHGTGVHIPHEVPSVDGIARCRIRLDRTAIDVSEEAGNEGCRGHGSKVVELPRYAAQAGVPVTIYRPPLVRLRENGELVPWSAVATDPSVSLYVTEAPLKALSLADHGMPSIGLGGVLAGPHVSGATLLNWGDVDPRSPNSKLRPSPDLASIDWRGRTAYVVFDANLAYRPLVALGAARLAFLLEGLGANVLIVRVPLWTAHDARNQTEEQALVGKGDQDQGPDDYIFRFGLGAFGKLVERAEPANVAALAQHRTQEMPAGSPERRQVLGSLLEDLYARAYCRVRGDAYVATQVASAFAPTFRVTAIRASIKEFGEHLSEAARAESNPGDKQGFAVRDGKLYQGDLDIADFSATIIEEVITDDGAAQTRLYRVSGELASGGSLPTIDVEATDFAKMEWVGECWGARATMRTRRWAYVAEGIQRLSTPKITTRYTHFGWRTLEGERAFLMPGGAITKNGWVPLDVEAPERLGQYRLGAVPAAPSPQEGLLWSLKILDVAPRHLTVPALLSVYMAPMVDMLGPTFVLWIHGPSGSAKSTFASLLQLHYGQFDYKTLPESWISTVNALETTLWRAKDVLLTIDNLVPAQNARDFLDQVSKAVRLIQSYGDGASRGRLNSDAMERPPRPPRCMPVATAEILPPENVSTLGRIFTLPFEGESYDMRLHDEIKARPDLLQTALAGWVHYLASYTPQVFRQVFEAKRRNITNVFGAVLDGGHPRLAEHLALFLVVKEFLYGYFRSVHGIAPELDIPTLDDPLSVTIYEGLAEAASKQPSTTSLGIVEEMGGGAHRTAPAVQQWLSTLRTLVTTGACGLAEGSSGSVTAPEHLEVGDRWIPKVGWHVGDEIWLLPEVSHDAVRRHLGAEWRWGNKEFQSQLRPFLQVTDGKNLGVKRSTATGRPRVWVLPDNLVLGERPSAKAFEFDVDSV